MNKIELRKIANAHWSYTLGVINLMLRLCKYLYIEAFIHGYKHKRDEKENEKNN